MASSNQKGWYWNYIIWVENHTPSGIKRSCDGSCTPVVDHLTSQLKQFMDLMRVVNRGFLVIKFFYLYCIIFLSARLNRSLSTWMCIYTMYFNGGGTKVLDRRHHLILSSKMKFVWMVLVPQCGDVSGQDLSSIVEL